MTRTWTGVYVALLLALLPQIAFALIEGAEGNEKLNDARLPKGAGAIINRRDRIAWWEGEEEFHADGRGDSKVINKILADFAKLDVKTKRVVVHDGVGQSYLINMDMTSAKKRAAQIDWTFTVWPQEKWEHSRRLFSRPNQPLPEKPDLPAQIDVYTANVRWADVVVPEGIEVMDKRLEAHGFTAADGIVIEGRVKELSGGQPVVASVRVQRIEIKKGVGGYVYTDVAESKSNAAGIWVLKNLPAAWFRIVVEADGFVPRVVGYAKCFDQPQWQSFESSLARAVSVSGRVTDKSGAPLKDVDVRLIDVHVEPGGEYESPSDFQFKTDVEGRFRSDHVPAGSATIWLQKSGYSEAGLGRTVTLPSNEIELQLTKAGSIRVTVDFNGKKRPAGYMVELEPEGGNVVGSYGGSATIDGNNGFTFENVPPGKYVVKGHPSRYQEREVSEAVKVDLQGDNAEDVTIKAK